MGRASDMRMDDEESTQKYFKKRDHLEDLGADVRII
jgi:hypothetical protein